MAKVPTAAQAIREAVMVQPGQASATIAALTPVTVNGCTLQPPPTIAKIGPVFSFNVADWKAAQERYKHGPKDASRYLQMKVGLPPEAAQWTIRQYEKLSRARLKKLIARGIVIQGMRAKPVFLGGKGIKLFDSTFLLEHKGFGAVWPSSDIPLNLYDLLKIVNDGGVLVWKEVVDGAPGAPVAKVEPPFDDDGHDWVLRVGMTGRRVLGVDVATGAQQTQIEATIKLQRLPRGILGDIEQAIGTVIESLKSVLATVCKLITHNKLQEVSNYAKYVPNPYVAAAALAWEGAAQACGAVLPAPVKPPDCAVTGEPPTLPGPDPWWKVHKNWLIGGGVVLVGALGISVFLRRPVA